jgi:hypothetical protein
VLQRLAGERPAPPPATAKRPAHAYPSPATLTTLTRNPTRAPTLNKSGGTFGFGELLFTSDTEMTFRAWSAVNRSVLFEASVSFA